MRIGGLQKFSSVDDPGHLSAVVFTQGCPWRCPFCHNASLVCPERFGPTIPQEEVLAFLQKRTELLESVVVSGGEPTVQAGLADFLREVRVLGYTVKLDTNGMNPSVVKKLLQARLVDRWAVDVKTSPARYAEAVGAEPRLDKIRATLGLLRESGASYELRTTVVPGLVGRAEMEAIALLVEGAPRYALQAFRPAHGTLDPAYETVAVPTREALEELAGIVRGYVGEVVLRF